MLFTDCNDVCVEEGAEHTDNDEDVVPPNRENGVLLEDEEVKQPGYLFLILLLLPRVLGLTKAVLDIDPPIKLFWSNEPILLGVDEACLVLLRPHLTIDLLHIISYLSQFCIQD